MTLSTDFMSMVMLWGSGTLTGVHSVCQMVLVLLSRAFWGWLPGWKLSAEMVHVVRLTWPATSLRAARPTGTVELRDLNHIW